jgi:hypothetical protein
MERLLFLDTFNPKKRLVIADEFDRKNSYSLPNLEPIGQDCFNGYGGIDSSNDGSSKNMGVPDLVFERNGFQAGKYRMRF